MIQVHYIYCALYFYYYYISSTSDHWALDPRDPQLLIYWILNAKECSNYRTIALISHASKVMLKILQARLHSTMSGELTDLQLDLEKAEEPEIKLPTSIGSSKKQEFQKNIYFCFIDYAKAFDCVEYNKLWKILKEMGIQDHMICLLRNLCTSQEATVGTGHRTTDGSK